MRGDEPPQSAPGAVEETCIVFAACAGMNCIYLSPSIGPRSLPSSSGSVAKFVFDPNQEHLAD
jgi:hypothetical protein